MVLCRTSAPLCRDNTINLCYSTNILDVVGRVVLSASDDGKSLRDFYAYLYFSSIKRCLLKKRCVDYHTTR